MGSSRAALLSALRAILSVQTRKPTVVDVVSMMNVSRNTASGEMRGRPSLKDKLGWTWQGSVLANLAEVPGARPAVRSGAVIWNYDELRTRSQSVAALIQERFQPGKPVAIFADRRAELVAALIGCIIARTPFLVLDSSYPIERLSRVVQVGSPGGFINVTSADVPDLVLERVDKMFRGVIETSLAIGRNAPATPSRTMAEAEYDDSLYIAFTSGSTGMPKGIIGSHGPVSHFVRWQAERFKITETDRVSMLSGLSHDPLLRDVLTPLSVGACICIPTPECYSVPGRLYDWIRGEGVTICHLTPGLGRILITRQSTSPPMLASLRLLFFGGDRLPLELAKKISQIAPQGRVVNFYGATETPQAVAYCEVLPNTKAEKHGHVPIGRGIDECQVLVLDENLDLCEFGVEGEICVRSKHTAKALITENGHAKVGVRNPANDDDRDRIYKTGDIGYFLSNGEIVFCGRRDRQVKIRGFRVEMAEIEEGIRKVLSSNDFVLDVEFSESQEAQLCLYLNDQRYDSAEIRRQLARLLPSYMVPDTIQIVDAIPLTPNGKVDRHELRKLGKRVASISGVPDDLDSFSKQIVDIFARVLRRPVLRTSLIQELSINSLVAVELTLELENALGLRLAAGEVFRHTTVENLISSLAVRKKPTSGDEHEIEVTSKENAGYAPKLLPKNENIARGILNRVLQLVARVAPDVWRVRLHRIRGVRIGQNVSIGYDTIVESSYPWLVRIADDVNIGMRCTIIGHFRGSTSKDKKSVSVTIEKGAFLGPGVIVLPNVVIGEGAVIAAGSVVAEPIPPHSLAQGNPAKPVAHCGLPLTGPVTYQEFLERLTPFRPSPL